MPKRLVLLMAAVILVVGATAGGFAFRQYNNRQTSEEANLKAAYNLCGTDEIGNKLENGALLDVAKHAQLKPIVDQILALPEYEKSPTCLYVLTRYYLDDSDLDKAKQNYNKLVAVFDKDRGYSLSLGTVPMSLDELKGSIEFLENQVENFRKNIRGVPVID